MKLLVLLQRLEMNLLPVDVSTFLLTLPFVGLAVIAVDWVLEKLEG